MNNKHIERFNERGSGSPLVVRLLFFLIMKLNDDMFPRVTDEYVVAGYQAHFGGLWFRDELLHIIKCAENTIKMYDEQNITDAYIKELDSEAREEEMRKWFELKKTPKKCVKDDLYLILDESSKKLKIGRSKNVNKRLRQLQTSNSGVLSILFTIKGMGYREESVHKKFAHLHINGEWYEYDKSIIDYFKKEMI